VIRRLLTPSWLVMHLVAVAGFVALVSLGRWQWHRAVELGRVQNYSYAVEWWLFAAFAVFLWVKTMADTLEDARAPQDLDVPEQSSVPAPAPALLDDEDDDPDDPGLAEYNRRLAALHAQDQASR
jgi:DNA-binding transcriptional regulator of glucitol operon